MRRSYIWSLMAALLIVVVIPARPVAAQEAACITFDDGSASYTVVEGTIVEGMTGDGLTSIYSLLPDSPPFTNISGMEARVSIPVDSKPESITWWAWMGEPNPYSVQIYLYESSTEVAVYAIGSFADAYGTWAMQSYTLPDDDVTDVDRIEIRYYSAWADRPGADVRKIIVDDIALGSECTAPEEDYVRPLTVTDVSDWGIEANPDSPLQPDSERQNTVFAFSNAPGAYVRAAATGYIDSVTPLTQGDCQALTSSTFGGCFLFGPDNGAYHLEAGTPFGGTTSSTPLIGYSRVILVSSELDKVFYYIVSNVLTKPGDYVTAGCYIGKTGPFVGTEIGVSAGSGGSVSGGISGATNPRGFSAVAVKDLGESEIIESIDDFTIEPPAAAPCNMPEEYKACIGDGGLIDEASWDLSGGTFNNPGFTLPPGAQLRSNPPLYLGDNGETGSPRARANVRSIGGNSAFTVAFGDGEANFNAEPVWTDFELPGASYGPDVGSLYTVLIANTGDSTIQVRFICVAFTETPDGSEGGSGGTPPPENEVDRPPRCIFRQSSFNNGTGGWTVSSAVQSGDGEILVPSGQTFSQPIALHPAEDGPQTYTLTVRSALWHYNTYVPDPANTDDVELAYDFPADSSFDTIATKTYGDYADSDIVTHQTTFEIEESTSGTFTLSPTLSSAPAGMRGIAIRDVCISAGDEFDPDEEPPPPPGKTYPPSQPPTDGGGPFTEDCNAISEPSGNDIGPWIQWQWAKMSRFYNCELMILLNQMYKVMADGYRLFGWGTRWAQATVMRSVNFLWSFVQWLNGHLSNIALGQTTTIVSSGETCGNVFCLIQTLIDGGFSYLNNIIDVLQQLMDYLLDPDSPFWEILKDTINQAFGLVREVLEFFINLINSIVSFILTIAELIIALILMVVGQVLNLAGFARDLIVSVISAWNTAAPTPIPGLPDCNTYSHFWCKGVWVLDNTIYAKTAMFTVAGPMEIIQTIMIGMGSMSLLLWCIKTFKQTVADMGTAI